MEKKIKKEVYLFKIDNTDKLIFEKLFWYIFFILFFYIIWLVFSNLDINMDKSQYSLVIDELSSIRFIVILIILFIIAPILTIRAIYKLKKQDNNIYFYKDKIIYHKLVIKDNDILKIKIGCCPLIKNKLYIYILIYGLAGWITIPLRLFDIFYFIYLKIINKNNLMEITHNFIIINIKGNSIVGSVYSKRELKNLKNYSIKEDINNGR